MEDYSTSLTVFEFIEKVIDESFETLVKHFILMTKLLLF